MQEAGLLWKHPWPPLCTCTSRIAWSLLLLCCDLDGDRSAVQGQLGEQILLAAGKMKEHFSFVEIFSLLGPNSLFPILCWKMGLEIGEALAPPSGWKAKESSAGLGHSCLGKPFAATCSQVWKSDKVSSGVLSTPRPGPYPRRLAM